jgi:hypothetical protein
MQAEQPTGATGSGGPSVGGGSNGGGDGSKDLLNGADDDDIVF